MRRVAAILVVGAVALTIIFGWFFGNFFYDLIWAFLEQHHIRQANVIAYTLSHIVSFLLACLVVAILFFAIRYELSREYKQNDDAKPALARAASVHNDAAVAAPHQRSNAGIGRIRITLGAGAPFEAVEPCGVNRRRTIRVKIENNTDAEIKDGKLEIADLDPPLRGDKDFHLRGGIAIGAHGSVLLAVCSYDEGSSQARVGTVIYLAVPMGGGWLVADALPGQLPVQPHTFYLKFSASEVGLFSETYCRIFVDERHILHLEDGTARHTSATLNPPPPQPRPPAHRAENAGHQPGITQIATGRILPPANYSKAQINRILEAIDAIYPTLIDLQKVLTAGTWTADSLEGNIKHRGAQFVLDQMDQLRVQIVDASDRLDRAVEKHSLYQEACAPIRERAHFRDQFFASYNDLASVLREIPEKLSAPALTMFVEARKQTFITRTAEYLAWAMQKKKALAEYREFYLRVQTTD